MSAVLAWTPRHGDPENLWILNLQLPYGCVCKACPMCSEIRQALGSGRLFAGPGPFPIWPSSGSFSVSRGSSYLALGLRCWLLSVALALASLPLQLWPPCDPRASGSLAPQVHAGLRPRSPHSAFQSSWFGSCASAWLCCSFCSCLSEL